MIRYLLGLFALSSVSASQYLYLANNGDSNVNIIDTTQSPATIVATVTVSNNSRQIAIAPNGYAYVTNQSDGSVSVINSSLTAPTVIATVTVGTAPYGIGIAPNGQAYIANSFSDNVSVINTLTSPPTVIATVTVGAGPNDIAFTSSGYAYVTNLNGDSITIINTNASPPVVVGTVSLTNVFPSPIAISASGYAYVGSTDTATVTVIDTNATPPAVVATVTVGDPFFYPDTIAIAPNGNVYVVNATYLNAIQGTTVVATVALGLNPPTAIAIDSTGSAYVSGYNESVVTAFNTNVNPPTLTATIPVGLGPSGLATIAYSSTGKQRVNHFFMQEDLVNQIQWTAPSASAPVTGYRIYRNSTQLLATVPNNQFTYLDHNRHQDETYSYAVFAVFASGEAFQIGNVTVNP